MLARKSSQAPQLAILERKSSERRLRLLQLMKDALYSAVGFDDRARIGSAHLPDTFGWARLIKSRFSSVRPYRRFYRPAFEGLEQRQLLAYDLSVYDINATGGAPLYDNSIVHDGKLYFADATSATGSELFAVDLSTNQKSLVADINVGVLDSSPGEIGGFYAVGTKLYFTAYDAANGYEPRWIDTSVANPTVNTIDVNAGPAGSNAGYYGGFTAVGTKLYFTAYDEANGDELRWIDTSVENPAVSTFDINQGGTYWGSNAGQYGGFTTVGTKLYFTAKDWIYGEELRWIDTSIENPTVNTIDVYPGAPGFSAEYGRYTAVGSKLFFVARSVGTGQEIHWIDTSVENPVPEYIDIFVGDDGSFPGRHGGFTAVGSKLYFSARDPINGHELRWIDTSEEELSVNTIDIHPYWHDSWAGLHGDFTAVGSKLYFWARGADWSEELRWLDTSLEAPDRSSIKTINTNTNIQLVDQYGGFKVVGTKFYFTAYDETYGRELRWFDTSEENPTVHTIDFSAQTSDSNAGYYGGLIAGGDTLYFTAQDAANRYELRWIDTTEENPSVNTIDIWNGKNSSNAGFYGGFGAVGNKLYFGATDSANENELRWIYTDGTSQDISTIDINPGTDFWGNPNNSNPGQYGLFYGKNNKLFFNAFDWANGNELRWIDTSENDPQVNTINVYEESTDGWVGGFATIGSKLYFSGRDATFGTELRWIDTEQEPLVVKTLNINEGNKDSNPGHYGGFVAIGTKLYFTAYDDVNGTELRWIDTEQETPELNTINIASGTGSSDPGSLGGFIAVGNKLYFSATGDQYGHELRWIDTSTNPSSFYTVDIYPGYSSYPGNGGFVALEEKLYFSAYVDGAGYELLWIDTNSAPSDFNVIDVVGGGRGSYAGHNSGFTTVGTKLYFAGYQESLGNELYWIETTDDPISVNSIDINVGTNDSYAGKDGGFSTIGGTLFFSAIDGVNGNELRWIDTVDAPSTVNVIDIFSGPTSSDAGKDSGFTAVDNSLFFKASSATFGAELFKVSMSRGPSDIELSSSYIVENDANFEVGIFSSVDGDAGDTFAYTLVSGNGDDDNDSFRIDGATLKTRSSFNYESQSSASIRVRTTDSFGLSFEKAFTLNVVDSPEMLVSPVFGDGTAQRSLIKQIVLTFDEEVAFGEGAISLIRRGADGGAVAVAIGSPTVTALGTQYQLTFSGAHTRGTFNALVDGYYELTIDGTKITRDGRQLDANSDGQLGDVVTLGDEEADKYFARYGDANGDGVVGISDFAGFRRAYGKSAGDSGYDEVFDFDGNSAIGASEFLEFRARYGKRKMDF